MINAPQWLRQLITGTNAIILSSIILSILSWIFAGKIYSSFLNEFAITHIEETLKLLLVLCIWLIACFIIVVYLLFQNKLKLKYNIYWDKKNNPHCPVYKKPGMDYYEDDSARMDPHFYCHLCKVKHRMYDDIGKQMPLIVAVNLLKKSS